MKKIFAALLAISITAALAGCSILADEQTAEETFSETVSETVTVSIDETEYILWEDDTTEKTETTDEIEYTTTSETKVVTTTSATTKSTTAATTKSTTAATTKPKTSATTKSYTTKEKNDDTVVVPKTSEDVGDLVWVPTNGGKKYHRKSSCSKMKDPMQVSRETAEANGYTPCKRCC